jgi:hypothetical protein
MAVIMNSLYCTESTTPKFLSLSGSNSIVKFVETSKTVVVVVIMVVVQYEHHLIIEEYLHLFYNIGYL